MIFTLMSFSLVIKIRIVLFRFCTYWARIFTCCLLLAIKLMFSSTGLVVLLSSQALKLMIWLLCVAGCLCGWLVYC